MVINGYDITIIRGIINQITLTFMTVVSRQFKITNKLSPNVANVATLDQPASFHYDV